MQTDQSIVVLYIEVDQGLYYSTVCISINRINVLSLNIYIHNVTSVFFFISLRAIGRRGNIVKSCQNFLKLTFKGSPKFGKYGRCDFLWP